MTLPEHHPIGQRTSITFPPEFSSGIEVDIQQQDWDTINSKYSQLWRIHNTIANLTPSTTYLERFDHTANPPWFQLLDKNRISINIPLQKKEEVAESLTNLTHTLANNPSHQLLYTDGSQTRTGFNGTGQIAIHA